MMSVGQWRRLSRIQNWDTVIYAIGTSCRTLLETPKLFLWLLSFLLFYRVAPLCGPSLSLLRWNPDHCFSCHEDDAFDRLDKKWWEPICRKPIWLRQAISLDSLNAPNKIWVLLGPFVLHMRRILDGGSYCHILYTHTYIYIYVRIKLYKIVCASSGPKYAPFISMLNSKMINSNWLTLCFISDIS